MGGREQFRVDIVCPQCGRNGHVVWEENAAGNRRAGAQRALIRLSPGFQTRSGQTQSGDPVIACNGCGAAQPD